MALLGPWVQDALRMMDSDGAWAHFKYAGALAEQPAYDMDVLDAVKSKWCELRNREMEGKYGKQAGGNNQW